MNILKYIKKLVMNAYVILKERTYYGNGTRVKYLYYKKKSKILVVCFSAYNKDKALYNYVRSLENYDVSRLYIKDDFGPNNAGSYYLGENGKHNVEKTVIDLIKMKTKTINDGKPIIVFVGSSKGGYAALNFGVEFENSYTIVGAPQYKLGSHLNEPFFYPVLEDIFGNINQEKIDDLDMHIKRKYEMLPKGSNQHIYLQYSMLEWSSVFNEYTYEKHIKYLINDIKEKTDIELHCEVLEYKDHGDVHQYFPIYLKNTLNSIIDYYKNISEGDA